MKTNPRAVLFVLGIAAIAGGIGGVSVGFIAGGVAALISAFSS
jgi:hypothetical protein